VFDLGYSSDPDGTGFGLAIVTEIVESHGWSVTVTDSDAGGARFEISGVEFA
jgi:signal transduction histidine kinase